jgi:hypothetical protein
MNTTSFWTGGVALAVSIAVSDAASAQQLTRPLPEAAPRGETVATRARPELDPLGIRAGTFLIYPKLGVDETYNDNVFAVNNGEKDDFITDIKPELSVESNWANHALNFRTGADAGLYSEFSRLDYTDWFVSGDGRLDITRDSAFFAGGGIAHEHEDPGEPDAPSDAKNPTEYDLINGSGRYVQKFGRFRGIGEATILRLDYDKTNTVAGPSTSNAGRDRNTYAGGMQLGYEFVPSYEAFVRAEGNERRYDQRETGGVERNSQGYNAVVGVSLDLGGVTFGDVYAGYLEQYYEDNAFNTLSAPTFGGALTWNATTLTTLNARVARVVQETTQTAPTGAASSGILRTTGGLSADHELLRNLILTAGVTITNDDYQDIKRNDYYYITGVGARYLMNRNVYANIGYQFVRHTTDGRDTTDNSYYQNLVRIGLEAQL